MKNIFERWTARLKQFQTEFKHSIKASWDAASLAAYKSHFNKYTKEYVKEFAIFRAGYELGRQDQNGTDNIDLRFAKYRLEQALLEKP